MAKRKDTGKSNDFRGAVRVARLLIVKASQERMDAWHRQAVVMQRVANATWFFWRSWHVERGNDRKIAAWMESLTSYRRAEQLVHEKHGKQDGEPELSAKERRLRSEAAAVEVKKMLGAVPTCPVMCWPNECRRYVYGAVGRSVPEAPRSTVAYSQKMLVGDMNIRPASNSSWKKWHRVLANYGEMPNYSQPQPIPQRPQDLQIIAPDDPMDNNANWRFRFTNERIETDGKGKNICDTVEVLTGGKKLHGLRHVLLSCYTGDLRARGGSIVLYKGRWYVHLCYQERSLDSCEADPKKVAIFEPAENHPWSLWIGDREIWVKGSGRLVEHHRRNLNFRDKTKRESSHSRTATGHGRTGRLFYVRLSGFKKTFSEQTVSQVVRICREHGCGTVLFRKPGSEHERATYLATAGSGSRPDSWPWHIVATKLNQACERVGINVKDGVWRPKDCEGSGGEKTPGSTRRNGKACVSSDNGNGKPAGSGTEAGKGGGKQDRSKMRSQVGDRK